MKGSKVAVLKTKAADVLEDYQKIMEMAGIEEEFDKTKTTILKDNISWHFPYPGANTTPWQLEGSILGLKELGYEEIVCVQNRTVVTDAHKGERLNKYRPVFEKYGIPVKYNFKEEDMSWVEYKPEGKMMVLDKIFPEGIKLPDYFFDKNILHQPTTKCHIYTTTTGAMKNAFGGLLNTKRHYCHSHIHETLVDLLKIQKEIHSGIFTVMDGTTAGNGPGPRTMTPVVKDYILASADSVAIDAVAAKMMGFEPMNIDYIRLAHQEGLGCGEIEEIEIIGEDISGVNYGFEVGDNLASMAGDMLWFGPLRWLQSLLFHTPLVYIFVFASFFYHDKVWYPLKGRKIVEEWQENTEWGRLFMEY
ncbi:MAG TPA: DUF362 domain-containing protein [Halanaerobiales bacterium]|nr:DUF362 domain-containing protein [Halanaerobiales bacterium]